MEIDDLFRLPESSALLHAIPAEVTRWDASVRFDRIEAPLARNTLELMSAALAESKA